MKSVTALLLVLFALLAAGCQRPEDPAVENVISFDRITDSLKPYDKVVIVLKNAEGDTVDVVFQDKVEEAGDLKRLKAPHWDGGPITVSITGISGGKVAYHVETRFDPATKTRDNVVVFVLPGTDLTSTTRDLTLLVGDSLPHPPVAVEPATLSDKTLEWEADPPGLLLLGAGHLKALRTGEGTLTARLKTNPSAKLSIPFTIATSGLVPESLSIEPESLVVSAGGASGAFTAKVFPSNASGAVHWTSADTTVAVVDSAGRVSGRIRGETTVKAVSRTRLSVTASARVLVTGPIPVESVAFDRDSLEITVEGAAENLIVSVAPSGANPAVTYFVADPSKASIQNGRISGTAVGRTLVIAASASNPDAKDTLIVKISGPVPVERVAFAFERQDILLGAAESLSVSVSPPGANPAVTFTLSDPSKATLGNGRITGTAAGTVSVIAVSVSNPNAKDTLIVTVKAPVPNDTVPPGKPTVRVSPAGPTRERRPTWSWTSGGGGAGSYQIALDKTVFDSTAVSMSDTVYRPGADLAIGMHILYVRERDEAGYWSPVGQAQVEIDTAAPAAPKIVGTTPTSSLPRWTWSSGGGGGAGIFRFRLADANFPAGAPEWPDTAYALTSAATGTTYTLFVQERDAAGNWSPAASHAIKYDLTKPNVTIAIPQASGTFITAADTIRVSGTSTGPNGIARVDYTLDGGAAVALTLGAGGAWATAVLTLPNAKTSVIKVTATDSLGNKGEAQVSVLRDSDPPAPPASLSNPASPTNVATASWTWAAGSDGTAGSGLSGKYRWKLNAGNWLEVATAAATGITLVAGSNVFSVQESDKAGNWSAAATDTVVLDNRAPDAVAFTGVDSAYTDDATPTWTWAPSTTNGGIAEYVLKLDAGAEFNWTSATYTPTTPLSDNAYHTLTVRQRDQVPGVVGAAKSFTFRVKVDPPAAPSVKSAVATLPDNGVTNNPRFTWTSGGGGNGKYRVRLNAETTYRVNGVAVREWTLPAATADGIYTLHVSEQDDMLRYGPEGEFTIQLDRTPPRFANPGIVGKSFPLRDGFVTNATSLEISYTSDAAPRTFICALPADTLTVCRGTAQTDAAGNSATFQTTVWRRSKVIFFSPTGTGDGSSWEEADDNLQTHLGLTDVNGKEFWLATGNYATANPSINPTRRSVTILGGFAFNTYPTTSANRNKTATTLGGITATLADPCTFDGLTFTAAVAPTAMGTSTRHGQFIDCTFRANITVSSGAFIDFRNCTMTNVNNGQVPIRVESNATMVWDGGAITGNIPPGFEDFAITINAGCSATFRNMTIANNVHNFHNFQAYTAGNLVIATSVQTFVCPDDLFVEAGATGSCKGTDLEP